jgi:hypothetical protein
MVILQIAIYKKLPNYGNFANYKISPLYREFFAIYKNGQIMAI